jgi:hypothetical protein
MANSFVVRPPLSGLSDLPNVQQSPPPQFQLVHGFDDPASVLSGKLKLDTNKLDMNKMLPSTFGKQ